MFGTLLKGTIRKKLALLFLISALPATLMMLAMARGHIDAAIEESEQELLRFTSDLADTQSRTTDSVKLLLETLAKVPEVRAVKAQACNELFATLHKDYPYLGNINLADLKGDLIASAMTKPPANFAHTKHFQDALRNRSFATGEYLISVTRNIPSIAFGVPVLDEWGRPVAVLLASIRLDAFGKQFELMSFPEDSFVGACDYRGIRIYRQPESKKAALGDPISETVFQAATSTGSTGLIEAKGTDGTVRIMAYAPLRLAPGKAPYMYVFSGVPKSAIVSKGRSVLLQELGLFLLAVGLTLLSGWFLGGRSLGTRLEAMAAASKLIGEGNFSVRVEPDHDVNEVATLAQAFNEMAGSLARDVEQRAKTEQALIESEARFKVLHNASFGGIAIHENGRISDCNQGLSGISGYSYEELVGTDVLPLIAEQSREMVMANILSGYEKPYEVFGLRKSGEVYPLRLEARNIPYQGRNIRVVEFRDITESRLAQQALEQETLRRSILMEKSRDGIVIIDQEHRVIEANERFAAMLGYSQKEVIGLYTWEYEAVMTEADIRSSFSDFVSVSSVFETRHRRKDGSLLDVEVSLSGATVAGQPLIFAICRDITERRKAEEEARQEDIRLRKMLEILQCDTTDTKTLLDVALDKCLELTGSRYGYIYHYDEDSQEFCLNTWSRDVMEACSIANPDKFYTLSKTGIWGEAVRQRRAIIVNDFEADNPLKRGYPEGHAALTSFMTVPLFSNNRIVAVVGVANKQGDYTEREVLQLSLLMDGTWRVLERLRAEETLRASEERLALTLDAADDGLWDWDVSSGLTYFSPRYYTMLGYQPGDFPASFDAWKSMLHPDDVENSIREVSGKLETAEPFETEFRMRTKSGEWAWILSRGKLVEKDADGRAKRMVGTHVDITERKGAEESLRTSAEIIAQIPSGLFVYQFSPPDSLYLLESNPEAQRLTGISAQEKSGEEFDEIWPAAKEMGLKDRFMTPVVTGERYETEDVTYQDNRISGAYRVRSFLLSGDRIAVSFEDVTERHLAEQRLVTATQQAQAANRAKSEFLANMSHEIRTPLNGVLGMLQLIKACEVSGAVESYAEMGLRAGKRLTSLLGDILDLSRIEAGRMPIVSKPFALANIFTALAETFSPMHLSKSLSLVINVLPDTPSDVVGDEVRVRQILFNLVGNAMKFTDQGEVRVDVSRLLPLPSGQTRLLFVVSDTGPGIPDEKIGQICAPFVQVDESYTRHHQGAGLGLSIATKLIDVMDGTLTFESEQGQGTSVYVVLPFSLPENSAIATASLEAEYSAKPEASLRLLLVEDEEISRLSARLSLEKLGHKVVTANNGEEALEALRVEKFDCVLMDIQMDVMDGLEATRWIRSSTSGALDARVPIIAMTAYAMAGDREKFLEAGMNDYVAKPVQLEELKKALGRIMRA